MTNAKNQVRAAMVLASGAVANLRRGMEAPQEQADLR